MKINKQIRWLICLVVFFLVRPMYGFEKFEPEKGWYCWMSALDPAEIQSRYPWGFINASRSWISDSEVKFRSFETNGQAVFVDWFPYIVGATNQNGNYERMAEGYFDTELNRMADFIVQEKWPVFLCVEREAQGHLNEWFFGPDQVWGTPDDLDPGVYAEAYRHMWQIFEAKGANKYVAWCWIIAPVWPEDYTLAFYPGDAYVNWVGFDYGSAHSRFSFEQTMEEEYWTASKSYKWFVTHFPDKPIFLGEQKAYKNLLMGNDLPVIEYWTNAFGLFNERYNRIKNLYLLEGEFYQFGEWNDSLFDTPALKEFMHNQMQSDLFLKYLAIQRISPGSEPVAVMVAEPTVFRWKSLWGTSTNTYKFTLYGADGVAVLNEQIVPESMQAEVSTSVNLAFLPENPCYWRVEAFSDTNVKYADSGKFPMTILAAIMDQDTGAVTPADVIRTWYGGYPIGQTFTTGPETYNLSAIELYCQSSAWTTNYGALNPTITLWDSPSKAVQLGRASIPSFNNSNIMWRTWYFGAVPVEPNRQYYFEIHANDATNWTASSNYYNQLLTAFNWDVGYPGGDLYYLLSAYSADLRFKTWEGGDVLIDQDTGAVTPADVIRTWYGGYPIGQTFTTGPETHNLSAIELYCRSWYTNYGGALNPTITLWDSPSKAVQLGQASIPSFNNSNIMWRTWYFGAVPVEPNRQYYFEITAADPSNYYNQLLTAFNWDVGYPGGDLYYLLSAHSADLRFKTIEAVPVEMDPIVLTAVQDKGNKEFFELRWSEVSDAARYLVQYAQTTNLSGTNMSVVEIEPGQFPTNCVYIVDKDALGVGSTWYWRVYALDVHKNCLAVSAIQPYQVNGPIFIEQIDYQYTAKIETPKYYYLVIDRANGRYGTNHAATVTVLTGNFFTASSTTNLSGLEICNRKPALPPPPDTDGDGMPDVWETQYGLNTNNASDAGGDLDNDGYANLEEYQKGWIPTDPNSPPPPPPDTDGDGMPDAWETQYGLNPNDPSDAGGDLDNDGHANLEEYQKGWIPTDPNSPLPPPPDTDGDGMPDAWETQYGLNPNDPSDAGSDLDNDGYTNLIEYKGGWNPTSRYSPTPKAESTRGVHVNIFQGTNTTLLGQSTFKPYYIFYSYSMGADRWLYFPLDLTVLPNTQYRVEFTLEPNPWNYGILELTRYPSGNTSAMHIRTWKRVQQTP